MGKIKRQGSRESGPRGIREEPVGKKRAWLEFSGARESGVRLLKKGLRPNERRGLAGEKYFSDQTSSKGRGQASKGVRKGKIEGRLGVKKGGMVPPG